MSYDASPTGISRFFTQLRQLGLVRTSDRWVGGIAGGLARRANLDPALMRLLVALLVVFGGVGLLAYGLAWLLLPEEDDGRIHLEELTVGHWTSGAIGALVTCFCGLPWALSLFFPWSWPFVLVLSVLAVILLIRDQQQPGRYFAPQPTTAGAPNQGPAWQATNYPATTSPQAPGPATASNRDDYQTGGTTSAASFASASYPSAVPTGGPDRWGPTPSRPWRTRLITQPRVLQVGPPHTLLTLGLGFSAAALAYWLGDGNFQSAIWAIAAFTVVLGGGLALAALRGRRSSTLTTLSVLFSVFVVAPAGLVSLTASPRLLATAHDVPVMLFSHSTSLAPHASLFGRHDISFTGTERLSEPLKVATWAGEINLDVPEGYPIEIHTEIGLGEIEARILEDKTLTTEHSAPSLLPHWLIDEADDIEGWDWDDNHHRHPHHDLSNRRLRFTGRGAHVLRLGEGEPRAVVYLTGGVGEINIRQFRK